MQITVLVSDMNYSSIAGKAIKGYSGSGALGKVGKAAACMGPRKIKRSLVISAVKLLECEILKSLNGSLGKEGLPISLISLEVSNAEAFGMELKVCLGLGKIDYAAIIPYIKENGKKFAKHGNVGVVLGFLEKAEDKLPLEGILESLPRDVMDKSVIGILDIFDKEITNAINGFAKEKGWEITIAKVTAMHLD